MFSFGNKALTHSYIHTYILSTATARSWRLLSASFRRSTIARRRLQRCRRRRRCRMTIARRRRTRTPTMMYKGVSFWHLRHQKLTPLNILKNPQKYPANRTSSSRNSKITSTKFRDTQPHIWVKVFITTTHLITITIFRLTEGKAIKLWRETRRRRGNRINTGTIIPTIISR